MRILIETRERLLRLATLLPFLATKRRLAPKHASENYPLNGASFIVQLMMILSNLKAGLTDTASKYVSDFYPIARGTSFTTIRTVHTALTTVDEKLLGVYDDKKTWLEQLITSLQKAIPMRKIGINGNKRPEDELGFMKVMATLYNMNTFNIYMKLIDLFKKRENSPLRLEMPLVTAFSQRPEPGKLVKEAGLMYLEKSKENDVITYSITDDAIESFSVKFSKISTSSLNPGWNIPAEASTFGLIADLTSEQSTIAEILIALSTGLPEELARDRYTGDTVRHVTLLYYIANMTVIHRLCYEWTFNYKFVADYMSLFGEELAMAYPSQHTMATKLLEVLSSVQVHGGAVAYYEMHKPFSTYRAGNTLIPMLSTGSTWAEVQEQFTICVQRLLTYQQERIMTEFNWQTVTHIQYFFGMNLTTLGATAGMAVPEVDASRPVVYAEKFSPLRDLREYILQARFTSPLLVPKRQQLAKLRYGLNLANVVLVTPAEDAALDVDNDKEYSPLAAPNYELMLIIDEKSFYFATDVEALHNETRYLFLHPFPGRPAYLWPTKARHWERADEVLSYMKKTDVVSLPFTSYFGDENAIPTVTDFTFEKRYAKSLTTADVLTAVRQVSPYVRALATNVTNRLKADGALVFSDVNPETIVAFKLVNEELVYKEIEISNWRDNPVYKYDLLLFPRLNVQAVAMTDLLDSDVSGQFVMVPVPTPVSRVSSEDEMGDKDSTPAAS